MVIVTEMKRYLSDFDLKSNSGTIHPETCFVKWRSSFFWFFCTRGKRTYRRAGTDSHLPETAERSIASVMTAVMTALSTGQYGVPPSRTASTKSCTMGKCQLGRLPSAGRPDHGDVNGVGAGFFQSFIPIVVNEFHLMFCCQFLRGSPAFQAADRDQFGPFRRGQCRSHSRPGDVPRSDQQPLQGSFHHDLYSFKKHSLPEI